MKLIFFSLFFVFMLSVFAAAVPPVRTSISTEVGLDISYPQLNYYPNKTLVDNIYFRWWVYNVSDGVLLTNNSLNCTFYLIDNTGRNTYRADMGQIGYSLGYTSCINCFYINVSKSNFTYYGGYYYQIRCFPSSGLGNYGGYISQYFAYINQKAYNFLFDEDYTDTTSGISVVVFVLFISAALLAMGAYGKFSKYEITNVIIKRSIAVIGIYLMVLNSAIIATIVESSGLNLTKEMFSYMWMFGTAGYVAMVYLIVRTILDVVEMWRKNKKSERGLDED